MSNKIAMDIKRPSSEVKKSNVNDFLNPEEDKRVQMTFTTTSTFKSRLKSHCADNNESIKDFIHRIIENELNTR